MGVSLSFDVKKFFFDRAHVVDRISQAEAKELSRIGAFIRTTARRRILRRRNSPSLSGQAPSVHSSDRVATLRNILFAYDPKVHGVVIGPVKLNQFNETLMGADTVPNILEFGGTIILQEEKAKNSTGRKWFRRNRRRSRRREMVYRSRLVKIEARPFMGKALDHEIQAGTIRDVWKASISD